MTFSAKAKWSILALLAACAAALSAWPQWAAPRAPKQWSVDVKASYPHDPQAFTQGLAFHDGALYEGTGQYGASSIRRRSEERRVGKECRSRWSPEDCKEKERGIGAEAWR